MNTKTAPTEIQQAFPAPAWLTRKGERGLIKALFQSTTRIAPKARIVYIKPELPRKLPDYEAAVHGNVFEWILRESEGLRPPQHEPQWSGYKQHLRRL